MISTQSLTKRFKSYKKDPGFWGSVRSLYKRNFTVNKAVKNFTLEVEQGEIVGLLGPNGAGKTTLMKMFTGIIVPSEGEVKVLGFDPSQREMAFRKQVALVMGQKSQLWWDIPAMDSFYLLQKYYEISNTDFKERIDHLAHLMDVKKILHVHVRKLSLGERMKMELMASLLHRPQILFLDEPTIGLDLVAQNNIRNFLRAYHREHKPTIILTSHYMADVEALCERIVLILDGEKFFDGSKSQFETVLGKEKFVSFKFNESVDLGDPIWKDYDPHWRQEGRLVDLRIPEEELRAKSVEILSRFPVTDFQTEKMPIERVLATLMNNPKLQTDEVDASPL